VRICLALLTLVAVYGQASAAPTVPAPFAATYLAEYRGIEAGTLTFTFSQDAATHQYTYETRANPSVLARLIVSGDALERSVMTIDDAGVHPVHWQVDDGKPGKKEDGELTFDAAAMRVTGEIKTKQVDLPIEPGLQDRISVQIAVMTALARGVEPGTIPMVDDDHIKYYQYRKKTTQTIDTKLGKLETVIYESTRENSNRVSRFWLAPSLGYAAVRAEQERKGKVETVMTIVELKR
jgi:hypothetical protein